MNSKKNGRFDVASQGDRFIPNRGSLNIDVAHLALMADGTASSDPTACIGSPQAGESSTSDSSSNSNDHSDSEYKSQLSSTLLNGASADDRILAFKHKAPLPAEGHQNNLRVLYSQNRARSSGATGDAAARKKAARVIAPTPERILDAPDIVDDYYLNLLDWSKDNVLAIALDKTVYLWDASSGNITQLMALEGDADHVTALQWVKSGSGAHLAIGTNSAAVQLWDVTRQKQLREMRGHQGRVCSLSWNRHLLTSGSRDAAARQQQPPALGLQRDRRLPRPRPMPVHPRRVGRRHPEADWGESHAHIRCDMETRLADLGAHPEDRTSVQWPDRQTARRRARNR